jgi:iron complex outermembrane receptor protein
VNLTVDAYKIDIENRIILSENLTAANVRNFLTAQGFIGVGGGRFFINGVDTTTRGVDVVVSWPMNAGEAGKFDFTVAGNFTKTDVTKVPVTAAVSALSPAPSLFDRLNVLSLEQGQPKNKINASANWKLGAMGATLRATRYGRVLSPGTTAALDFTLGAKTVIDLEGRYDVSSKLKLALGAENLFDAYPESVPVTLNGTGNAPFPNYAPFGRAGRFVYARATYSF